jgi:hypothetical protein
MSLSLIMEIEPHKTRTFSDTEIALVTLSREKVTSYNERGELLGCLEQATFVYGYTADKIVIQLLDKTNTHDSFEVRNHQFEILEKIPVDTFKISEVLGETFVENPLYIFDEPSEESYASCLVEIKRNSEESLYLVEQLCHQHNALILKMAKSYDLPFQLLQDSFTKNSFLQQIYTSLKKRIEIDFKQDSSSLLELGSWIVRQEMIKFKKT